MTVALLWFRRNLRLSDNSALLAALDRAESVVPVFVHRSTPSAQGPGMASLSWLSGSLASLDLQLRERGSALIVRTGMPPAVLAALAEETGARSVHCERDWTPEGLAEERAVGEALAARGVALEVTEGQLLVTPTGLATQAGGAYSVFTPFWRAWRQAWAPTDPKPAPRHVPAPADNACHGRPGLTTARCPRHHTLVGTGRARGPGAAGGVRRWRYRALRRLA